MLSYIDDGYGDYIDMKIDGDGNLVGFPKEKMDMIDKILTRLCLEAEDFKISLDRFAHTNII